MPSPLYNTASIADMRLRARRRLPRAVFDFIDGAAADELTRMANEAGFARGRLSPRVAVDVSRIDTSVDILGFRSALPLMLAPTGLAGFYWPDGEIAAARAAAKAGIPFCLSTNSVASLEAVAGAVPSVKRWFQLYMLKDRALMWDMVERAEAHGYDTLCLTLDLAVQGRRDRDIRSGFTVPMKLSSASIADFAMRPRWLWGALRRPVAFGNFASVKGLGALSVAQFVGTLFDPTVDWAQVAEVRKRWRGPMVIKGILNPDDARRCVELGAQGVIVSNHGGRQLDQVPASIEALPQIADAVAGRAAVYLDGGVRRGTDLIKARALGADACLIGRPFLWGLSAAGEPGVDRVIDIFREELAIALALLGHPVFSAIRGDILVP
jgi:isopentenyl diphosphate isomerase/L-lactate dehydrogenase-like FMN-dependent dehydrogenase